MNTSAQWNRVACAGDCETEWSALRMGSRDALNTLFETHVRAMYAYAKNISGNEALVSDCIQDDERVKSYNPISAPSIDDFNNLWPIPQTEIDANLGAELTQSAGYN